MPVPFNSASIYDLKFDPEIDNFRFHLFSDGVPVDVPEEKKEGRCYRDEEEQKQCRDPGSCLLHLGRKLETRFPDQGQSAFQQRVKRL